MTGFWCQCNPGSDAARGDAPEGCPTKDAGSPETQSQFLIISAESDFTLTHSSINLVLPLCNSLATCRWIWQAPIFEQSPCELSHNTKDMGKFTCIETATDYQSGLPTTRHPYALLARLSVPEPFFLLLLVSFNATDAQSSVQIQVPQVTLPSGQVRRAMVECVEERDGTVWSLEIEHRKHSRKKSNDGCHDILDISPRYDYLLILDLINSYKCHEISCIPPFKKHIMDYDNATCWFLCMLHCCMLKIQGLWLRHAWTSWTIQAAEVDVAFLDAAEKDKLSDTMIAIGKLPKISNRNKFVWVCSCRFLGRILKDLHVFPTNLITLAVVIFEGRQWCYSGD